MELITSPVNTRNIDSFDSFKVHKNNKKMINKISLICFTVHVYDKECCTFSSLVLGVLYLICIVCITHCI